MKNKKINRFWYLVAFGVIIIIILMITSSVLQIGDRLRSIHEYAPYIFYGISVLLIYFLIIRPVMIILFSPSFSINTTLDQNPRRNYIVFKKVTKTLLNDPKIPDSFKEKLKESIKDPKELRDALNVTYNKNVKKRMNKTIRNHAKTVMVSTAISQNGRLDFITVLVVNIRMIKELVVMCGFRPSYKNLSKLIINVFTTALIAEGLDNLKISDILPQSTMNMLADIPLIKPIMSSVVEGISNALLTLRIGVVTRKYLFDDASGLTKEKIRFGALLEASKHLPIVISEGVLLFPKTIVNMFKKNKVKEEDLDS